MPARDGGWIVSDFGSWRSLNDSGPAGVQTKRQDDSRSTMDGGMIMLGFVAGVSARLPAAHLHLCAARSLILKSVSRRLSCSAEPPQGQEERESTSACYQGPLDQGDCGGRRSSAWHTAGPTARRLV